ncbi:hypothetical protein [Solibacillus sp. FSL K6-1126]|uniref:hypothetical protein n=1 Tax=Solibacillus sp. FSL K6-1126 TaxID=2921463 RepID=UPI0030F69F52
MKKVIIIGGVAGGASAAARTGRGELTDDVYKFRTIQYSGSMARFYTCYFI